MTFEGRSNETENHGINLWVLCVKFWLCTDSVLFFTCCTNSNWPKLVAGKTKHLRWLELKWMFSKIGHKTKIVDAPKNSCKLGLGKIPSTTTKNVPEKKIFPLNWTCCYSFLNPQKRLPRDPTPQTTQVLYPIHWTPPWRFRFWGSLTHSLLISDSAFEVFRKRRFCGRKRNCVEEYGLPSLSGAMLVSGRVDLLFLSWWIIMYGYIHPQKT